MEDKKENHACSVPDNAIIEGYGIAIDYCSESEGKLWVGNGEYCNSVNFCPFCGYSIKDKKEQL